MRASPSLTSVLVNNVDETMSLALRCLQLAWHNGITGGKTLLVTHVLVTCAVKIIMKGANAFKSLI